MKEPPTKISPFLSIASELPHSRGSRLDNASELPKRLDQRCAPADEYFAIKISWPPALVRVPPPKLMPLTNQPVTTILPLLSTATASGLPEPGPAKPLDQICWPVAEYFA